MAVIVKYVVERNGKEVMTFTTKKEADAYDKQLEIAEHLYDFLSAAGVDVPDKQMDELAFFMAQHRDDLAKLLKGSPASAKKPAAVKTDENVNQTNSNEKPAAKAGRGAKKAVAA